MGVRYTRKDSPVWCVFFVPAQDVAFFISSIRKSHDTDTKSHNGLASDSGMDIEGNPDAVDITEEVLRHHGSVEMA